MTTPLGMDDINVPPHARRLAAKRRPVLNSTPFTASRNDADIETDLSSFSLEVTLDHLVDFLVSKLVTLYPAHHIASLRQSIIDNLTPKLAPTWDPLNPSSGCGVRSLIALPGKFPTPLVNAAIQSGIDPVKWTRAISETGEWEIWVDPGSVCFREGEWAFADDDFENKTYKQTLHTVWQAPLSIESMEDDFPTTSRPMPSSMPPLSSRKPNMPNRAPAVFRIPPTPMPLVESMNSLSLQSDSNRTPSPFESSSNELRSKNAFNGGIAMMGGTPLVKRTFNEEAASASGPGWNTVKPLKSKRIAPQVVAMPIGDAAVGSGRRSVSPSFPSTLAHNNLPGPRSVSLGTPSNASDLLALLNRKPEPQRDEQIHLERINQPIQYRPKTPPNYQSQNVQTHIFDTPGSTATVKPRSPSSVAATFGATISNAPSSPSTEKTSSPSAVPKVQGYDGGNVGVLGGGVKLGGLGVPKSSSISGHDRTRSVSGGSATSGMSSLRTASGSSSLISEEDLGVEPKVDHASSLPAEMEPISGIVHPHQPKRRRGRPQNRQYFNPSISSKGGLPMQPGTGIAGQPGSGIPVNAYGHQGMGYGNPHVPILRPGCGVNVNGTVSPQLGAPKADGHGQAPGMGWNNGGVPGGIPLMSPHHHHAGPGWGVNPAVLNNVGPQIGRGVPGQPGISAPRPGHRQGPVPPQPHGSHLNPPQGINMAAWNLGVASGLTRPSS